MRHFTSSIIFTVLAMVAAVLRSHAIWWGREAAMTWGFIALVLGILEVSLSFDNAVVNAAVLETMTPTRQRRFLTRWMAIAVFGVRIIFPVAIVALAAWIDPITVLHIAFTNPDQYAAYLISSHAAIASFGGMFLLMVFLKFILDPLKEIHWIHTIEKYLIKVGKLEAVEVLMAMTVLLVLQALIPIDDKVTVLVSGIAWLATFVAVDALSSYLHDTEKQTLTHGVAKAWFGAFMYLEILDASFSFDGVIGAFAISKDIVIIALWLGIGAMFVRSLTLYLVKKGTLQQYIYLEHGAHYAIGILAIIMLASIKYHIPEVFTGISGAILIWLSLRSSHRHNKSHQA